MSISEQERERISTAIRAAEAKTSGEIVCVLAQNSSDATALLIFRAMLARVLSHALARSIPLQAPEATDRT